MRSILLPVEANTAMESSFAVAHKLASRLGARVEGVALKPGMVRVCSIDGSAAIVPRLPEHGANTSHSSRSLFDQYRAAYNYLGTNECRAEFNWSGGAGVDDDGLGSLAGAFDITVVGRPGNSWSDPRMTTLEGALFKTGRPVLMTPPEAPKTLGTNVLIHWNGASETIRAIAHAMPLLKSADRISLVSVEDHIKTGPSATAMVANLAANGLKATARHVQPTNKGGCGEAILVEARRIAADLIVKGAYTQARLWQMIFGGTTRHILQWSQIPVVFSR